MKITKYGHCCLLIESQGLRLLTDPGAYSIIPEHIQGIDAVLITHEHADHLHMDALKSVLAASPASEVITNSGVGKLLRGESINFRIVEEADEYLLQGKVRIRGFGREHAEIYRTVPPVYNTGYLIDKIFFYPGDAFTQPHQQIQCLALPVAGPWLTIAQAIDYARAVNPKRCFPVHDGNLKTAGIAHKLPGEVLPKSGIEFSVLGDGESIDI